jgi:hypothetical protein
MKLSSGNPFLNKMTVPNLSGYNSSASANSQMSGYAKMKMLDVLKGKIHENVTVKEKKIKRKIKLR